MPDRHCLAPVFGPSSALDCALLQFRLVLLLVVLIVLLAVTLGSPAIRCLIQQTVYRMKHCREGNRDPNVVIDPTPDAWLAAEPAIRDAIVWRPRENAAHPYRNWTAGEKRELAAVYRRLQDSGDAGLSSTPAVGYLYWPGQEMFAERERILLAVSLPAATAWPIFLAHVAQSLLVEIRGLVPWSVRSAPAEELALLFDSQSLFLPTPDGRHAIYPGSEVFSHGAVTPGDPGRTFRFLRDNGLIGPTGLDTIGRTVDWCRELRHQMVFVVDDIPDVRTTGTRDSNEAHWQYEGFSPVERIVAGTVRRGLAAPEHWTAGCWGTSGFLRAVLRTANIGVRLEPRCGHALPHFVRDRRFLSHGDDPYNLFSRVYPRIPVSALLLDVALLERWFGASGSCDYVGRGVAQAVRDCPPYEMLRRYCRDQVAGLAHADGEVYEYFARFYTLAELEADGLWRRLATRVAELGGCDRIPDG